MHMKTRQSSSSGQVAQVEGEEQNYLINLVPFLVTVKSKVIFLYAFQLIFMACKAFIPSSNLGAAFNNLLALAKGFSR